LLSDDVPLPPLLLPPRLLVLLLLLPLLPRLLLPLVALPLPLLLALSLVLPWWSLEALPGSPMLDASSSLSRMACDRVLGIFVCW